MVRGLALCGIGPEQLPAVAPLGLPLRAQAICTELPLREDVEIVLAGNDQTAGAFGNGCREDDLVATLGTALVAYRYAGPDPGPFSELGCWGPYPGGGTYELGVRNHGCLALDWARERGVPGHVVEGFMASAEKATATRTAPTFASRPAVFLPRANGQPEAWVGPEEPAGERLRSLRALASPCASHHPRPGGQHPAHAGHCYRRRQPQPVLVAAPRRPTGCPVRRGLGDARTALQRWVSRAPAIRPSALPGAADESQPLYQPTPSAVRHYKALYESWCAQK